MKIRYRPRALEQLASIHDYIAERDRAAARRVIAAIKASIDRLSRFPLSARASQVPGIRELPVVRLPYIVFYTINDTTNEVQILRVRHTSQDPIHHLD